MRNIFVLILSLTLGLSSAQIPDFTVYYDSGVYRLNQMQKKHIKKQVDAFIGSDYGVSVQVKAYTDNVGSVASNQQLSEKRGGFIKTYLSHDLDLEVQAIKVAAMGENNASDRREQANSNDRRVDVYVTKAKLRKTEKKISKEEPELVIETPTYKEEDFTSIMFSPGRSGSALYVMSYWHMDKMVTTMKERPNLNIHLKGHVCCGLDAKDEGYDNDKNELHLSANRAIYVKEYLVEKGIDRNRISNEGVGYSEPKFYPEANKKERKANRRVTITGRESGVAGRKLSSVGADLTEERLTDAEKSDLEEARKTMEELMN